MKKIISISFVILLFLVAGTNFYFKNNKKIETQINTKTNPINTIPSSTDPIKLVNQPPVRVPILVYHSVRPYYKDEPNSKKIYTVEIDNFVKQLQYIKSQGYITINFDDLVNYFKGKQLPTKPIIINFDDGLENQYTNAFPLLKKEGMTATFFIYSNAIGHKNFLTWEQVKELSDANMTIGGHSKSHPYLWKITDPSKLKEEIADNKKIIEDRIGKTLTTFAYPFGLYKSNTIAAVKAAGYITARTGYERATHTKKELYTLHSIQVSNDLKMFVGVLKNLK